MAVGLFLFSAHDGFSVPHGVAVFGDVFTIPPESLSALSGDAPPGCFIGGKENLLAREAVESLFAEDCSFRLLLLFGPTATGKSLLARDVADRWRRERPDDIVLVTTGADFARDYATACMTDSIDEFHLRHRRTSLLVLEDAHELTAKPAAQEELVRTLDFLDDEGARVVVTMQESPLSGRLNPALASRLVGGLSVPLCRPGESARRAILLHLFQSQAATVDHDALELLANKLDGPVTTLRSAVLQLAASNDKGKTITREAARHFLETNRADSQPTIQAIAAAVARRCRVSVADMRGPSRRKAFVRARGTAMLAARRTTNMSLAQIGEYFGGRDHTTVMYACRKTSELAGGDAEIRQLLDEFNANHREQPVETK